MAADADAPPRPRRDREGAELGRKSRLGQERMHVHAKGRHPGEPDRE